jgi:hypothetical protein
MDGIDLAQNSDRWSVVVSAVLNLLVPQKRGKFLDKLKTS